MSKVLWHITMSLDGFVAGPGDDMGWLFGCGFDPDPQFVLRTLDQIGAVLIGHRTYHGGDGDQGAKTEKGEPYGGAWHGPQFVYTRDDPGTAAPGFTFVSDIKQAVQLAKTRPGRNTWPCWPGPGGQGARRRAAGRDPGARRAGAPRRRETAVRAPGRGQYPARANRADAADHEDVDARTPRGVTRDQPWEGETGPDGAHAAGMQHVRAAWRRWVNSPARDVIFALGLAVVLVGGSYGEGYPKSPSDTILFKGLTIPHPGVGALALVAVACLALAWRRQWPVAVLGICTAAVCIYSLLGYVNGAAMLAPAIAV